MSADKTDRPSTQRSLDSAYRALAVPAYVWLTCFVALPLLGLFVLAFCGRETYGNIIPPFTREGLTSGDFIPALTLENFYRLAGFGAFGFKPLYPEIFVRTIVFSAACTVICVLLGAPLAFWAARLPPKQRNFVLVAITIPFWTNLLIRTYAWQILLSPDSVFSAIARFVGLIGEQEGLYPGRCAALLGLTFDYLPFFILPLYASVGRVDWSIFDAALDLGASGAQAFRHAILPQIQGGLMAGGVLVFIPALGQFVVSDLLGGSTSILLGNAIAQQYRSSNDWPFGAAIAATQALIALAFVVRLRGGDGLGGTKK
jgi:spermidine/putrescine transport system permease protein